jgi:hypothetical protein
MHFDDERQGTPSEVVALDAWESDRPTTHALVLDSVIIDQAAEALYSFVFSACHRLDGEHRWIDCDERTKAGFRQEATAVLASIWPLLTRQEQSAPRVRLSAHIGGAAANAS